MARRNKGIPEGRLASYRRLTLLVSITTAIAFAFAWLWPQRYEGTGGAWVYLSWIAFMLRVFQAHIGVIVLLFLPIALLVRSRLAIALCAVVPAVLLTSTLLSFLPNDPPKAEGQKFRVMSINLLVSNNERADITKEILDADADVVVIQEYGVWWHGVLQEPLGERYPYVRYETRVDSFGTAIYSRLPFTISEEEAHLPLGSDDVPQSRNVIELEDGSEVALYNVHFLPPPNVTYYREARLQFADLLEQLEEEELPVIIAGDLNLNELTPQHRTLREVGMRDAWEIAERGRGPTWPNIGPLSFLPGFRLDHLYLSDELTATNVERGVGSGSDHRPVTADLTLTK